MRQREAFARLAFIQAVRQLRPDDFMRMNLSGGEKGPLGLLAMPTSCLHQGGNKNFLRSKNTSLSAWLSALCPAPSLVEAHPPYASVDGRTSPCFLSPALVRAAFTEPGASAKSSRETIKKKEIQAQRAALSCWSCPNNT